MKYWLNIWQLILDVNLDSDKFKNFAEVLGKQVLY